MKYSLRKSFSLRRGKKLRDVDLRNSDSNLVKPVKSQKRRSSSSSSSLDRNKSKVFEPRYDIHSSDDEDNDDNQQLVSSSTKVRPFNRLTDQIRRSFRNTLHRRSTPDQTNSILPSPPIVSIGLTSPLIMEENQIDQRRKTSTQINQSNSFEDKSNLHRSFRTRFSFLRKKSPIIPTKEHSSPSPPSTTTLTQRFHFLRRSLPLGRRNSSSKGQRHLLSNE